MELFLSTRVRLGDFELDLQTGELRAIEPADTPNATYLRAQPFQVLKMLIERNGKVVTREEIRKRLWPNDTIVDFDHSINVAIGVLRRAFKDSANQPKYIETLAKRGYRLVVGVEARKTNTDILAPAVVPSVGMTSAPSSMSGKKASHYRVLGIIGGGGMGMVYEAEDLRLGRRVALKFLPDELATDPIALKRFEREAQTASALNHPNICTIYEVEEFEGHPFIVMELLEGENLHHHLDTCPSRTLSVERVIEIGIQICNGLQAAHEKGIIHRDVKPANIFLTDRGPVKILDFGLAKLAAGHGKNDAEDQERLAADVSNSRNGVTVNVLHADLTRTGAAGTVGYMSPEQVRREPLNACSDLFTLGLILYEAATGVRAFPGTTAAAVHAATLDETPTPAYDVNSSVPHRLWAVIAKALEKDPARRYQSAAEMRIALEQIDDARLSPPYRWRWLVAAALLVSIAGGACIYWRSRHAVPAFTAGDTVVVAVNNHTSDPVFNEAIFTSAYYGLLQTPFVHVLRPEKLFQAIQQLGIKTEVNQSTDEGRKVCVQTKSRMVIASTIADEGDGFRIEVEGIDCQSGVIVARASTNAVARTNVIHQLGVTLIALRRGLGEPAASLTRFNYPLDEATSASPEALQLLTDGYMRNLAYDMTGAIATYQRAVALDANFALAYSAMGAAAENLKQYGLQQSALKRAYALRLRTPEAIRFNIDDLYYEGVTEEWEKARVVSEQWVQAFPDDLSAHNNLSRCYSAVGRHDAALAEAREAVRLFPSPWAYGALLRASIYANRFDEARSALDQAIKLNFDSASVAYGRLALAFLENKPAFTEDQLKVALRDRQTAYLIADSKAETSGYHGHLQDYLRESAQAEDMAKKAGYVANSANPPGSIALHLADEGNIDRARRIAEPYVGRIQRDSSPVMLALALARAGDVSEAEKVAGQVDHDAPLSTAVQEVCLPTIRAAIKLHQNDAAGAIEALQPALKYDLALTDVCPSLYSVYLRGLAYLQKGNGKDAEAEFQKLYDHPGLVRNQVIGALARLQMARAQRLAGDRPAARKSYEEFLRLWRTADPDIPIYGQAKAEYAELASLAM